jgi:glucosylceramidase
VSCLLPQIDCGGLCADPANNALHCGGCNRPCASDQICTNSMCVTGSCPGGTRLCNGACVDTQADPLNCGNCGAACLVSQSCQGGICSSSGTGGTGGAGGAGPTGGTAGSGGSGPTGGSGGDAGMAGSAGMPVVLPPLVTSAPNAYWKTDGTLSESTANATVTVNDTQAAQTWEGFGGSFNELGWSFLTTQQMKDTAIRLLFSATDGANFVWGRIPIGASDYARTRYTLNDTGTDVVPNGETNRPPADTALAMFSLARDGEMLIPYIKAAQAHKPSLRFWASPWTPPSWMKTGYKTNGGSGGNAVRPSFFDGGNMNAAHLAAYAQYFVKFVEGYKAQGINVEVVSPQNEPGYDQNYPSCLWDATTYTTFIGQHLGPAMMGLGVRVMLGTMSNAGDGGRNDIDIANAVLANSTARGFLSVAGVQWGVLDRINSGTMLGGLPIWATEHKCGNYPWNPAGSPTYNSTQAPNDQAYAIESWGYLRNAIRNGKVTAYSAWNMVLDRLGLGNDTSRDWRQNALLVADGGQVNPTPTYYVFRHMAQYVAPGAIVVATSGGDALGFKNPDGSIVAVMFNSGAASNNYVVAIGGRKLQFAMPGNGWATVKYKP